MFIILRCVYVGDCVCEERVRWGVNYRKHLIKEQVAEGNYMHGLVDGE